MGSPAVFLDRDGTINEEVGFLYDPEQVSLIPRAAEALVRLRDAGFRLIVVTNQSGIARGLFSENELHHVNRKLAALLAERGAKIDAYYFCPHHPNFGDKVNCDCRKPKPGMARQAVMEFGVDLSKSYFVGDKLTDIELGKNAGGKTVLVLTGYGSEEKTLLETKGVKPDRIFDALPEAADWIVQDLKKILIIKPSSLGDVIHALPVAASLKSGIPDARIDWVVGSPFRDILEGNPDIARLIPFDRGLLKGGQAVYRLTAFLSELRRESYDLVIDLQGLLRSALMAAACRAEKRAGFSNAREGAPFFYTDKVPVRDVNMHAVDRYLLTLRHLGLDVTGKPLFRIVTGPEDESQADAIIRDAGISEGEPFVAVAPSARWETKRWPAGNFLELARRLGKERGLKALFVGSGGDRGLFGGLDVSGFEDAFAFGRTTLKGLAALLGRAKLLITNDSGPMHVAAAVGTPCAAFFGPTDPKRTGPYGDGHRIISAGTGCAPCFKRDCKDVKCLKGITAEMAYAEITTML